ncbi:MAG TPA: hypothetical protein VK737_12155 [Opitutales bacterium]|jgi:hypothetical protein|nr:hypothetical protein [Opitutales bacterium]
MSLAEYRPLIVRGNRALGSLLQEKKLVTAEQLDAANEKLVEYMEQDDVRRASILHILLFESQALKEDDYLEALVEKSGFGVIDLRACLFKKFADLHPDFDACWATWAIPFDVVDDFHLLATTILPGPPTQKFWQDKYPGKNLLWYVTSVRSFQTGMEKLENLINEAAKTAKPPASAKSAKGLTKPAQPVKKS